MRSLGIGAGTLLNIRTLAAKEPNIAISGKIKDRQNTPIPNTRVMLFTLDLSYFRETRTDSRGKYLIEGVPQGVYKQGASAINFEYQETTLTINSQRSHQDFHLGPETNRGEWNVIGDTAEETFGGTNSGVLLTDGRLMFCHDTIDPIIFEPSTGRKSFPEQSNAIRNSPDAEQGCHNLTHLLDGRILYVGGGTIDDQGNFTSSESALKVVKAFDPQTGAWEVLPPLNEVRWYPGLVRLSEGELIAIGGGQQPAESRTSSCEIFDPITQAWRPTGSLRVQGGFGPSALLYSGEVFLSWYPPQVFNPETEQWRETTNFLQPNRGTNGDRHAGVTGSGNPPIIEDHPDHSIVVLPDGRIAAIGIWGAAMSNPGSMVEIFDPATETWSLGANPATIRAHPEVLQLPDKRILVAGGAPQAGAQVFVNEFHYTNAADLYDPASDSWRAVAPLKNAREYHAITLLLPDGRVLVQAGTGEPGLNPSPFASPEVEAFSPPYLFRGPRPHIDAITQTHLTRGATVTLTVSFASPVTGVRLIGINAITHFLDAGVQRLLDLSFTQAGSTVVARIPDDTRLAMAGYYMLFVMVDDVPSKGKIVKIDHD